tara:strand:- start:1419 stop:1697 length:279 start_codon:yes stop_codon:yes gene_type:complete
METTDIKNQAFPDEYMDSNWVFSSERSAEEIEDYLLFRGCKEYLAIEYIFESCSYEKKKEVLYLMRNSKEWRYDDRVSHIFKEWNARFSLLN